jgi:hypothetical protein
MSAPQQPLLRQPFGHGLDGIVGQSLVGVLVQLRHSSRTRSGPAAFESTSNGTLK